MTVTYAIIALILLAFLKSYLTGTNDGNREKNLAITSQITFILLLAVLFNVYIFVAIIKAIWGLFK